MDMSDKIRNIIRSIINEVYSNLGPFDYKNVEENKFIDALKTKDSFYKQYSNTQIQNFLDYKRETTIDTVNRLKIGESAIVYIYMPMLGYSKDVKILNTTNGYEVIANINLKDIPSYDINYNQLISGLIQAYNGKTDLEHLEKLHTEISNFKDVLTPQQKQQAQSKFQEYVNATGKQDIGGFKQFVNQSSTSVKEGVGFKNYNGITVELGRSKVVERGKVQNIIVKYNGKPIVGENKESGLGEMNVMIQSKDAFVGMIRIPTELQGKGLSKYIYQATADLIDTPIINSKERGESQTESGGYVWKNKTSFQPNQITPQQKQQAQQLYSQYVEQTGKQDIEGFKDFVSGKPTTQPSTITTIIENKKKEGEAKLGLIEPDLLEKLMKMVTFYN